MDKENIKKTNKVLKGVKIAVDTLLYLLVATMLIFSISILSGKDRGMIPNLFGNGYLAVKSDSMQAVVENETWPKKGAFNAGDLIFVKMASREMIDQLEVGDVITFFDTNIQDLNTHRVVELQAGYLYTIGDKAASSGSQLVEQVNKNLIYAIHYSPSQGIELGVASGIGSVLMFLQQPTGFFVVVLLPCLAILIYEGIKLARIIVSNNRKKNEAAMVLEKETALKELELEKERLKAELLEQIRAEEEAKKKEKEKE